MRRFLLAFALLCMATSPAVAQDESSPHMMRINPMPPMSTLVPVPEEMQQRWIMRSCEKGDVSFRFSRRFLMVSITEGSTLFRLGGLSDQGNGRYTMTMPGEITGLMMGSDGKLIQYFGNLNTSFSRDALEALRIMIPHIKHENCTNAENVIVNEDPLMLSLLPSLDAIQEACPDPQDIAKTTCQRTIFLLFDQNKDGALDETELERGWDLLVANSPFGTCAPDTSAPDSLRGDGDAYIAWMTEHLDQDKDKRITFEDFAPRWREMQEHPLMSGLTNLLIAADGQVGILPDSVKVTCVNCCVATMR